MKHGKKPTVRQSLFIQDSGFNPREWLVVKDTSKEMWIVQKSSGPFSSRLQNKKRTRCFR